MSKNIKNTMLFNIIGISLLLFGSSLFYTGVKGLMIDYISSDPIIQFYIGLAMLFIAYYIFGKKFKGLN